MALGIHVLNILLLRSVIIGFNSTRSYWLALLAYGVNPLHLISLNWLTQTDLELAVTFSLLTILFYRKALESKRPGYWAASLTTFSLALLSHEIASVIPIFLVLWFGLNKQLIIFLTLAFAAVLGKYAINPFPLEQDYSISFSPIGLLSRAKWYLFRAVGLPEGIRNLSQWQIAISLLFPLTLISTYKTRLLSGLSIFLLGLLPVIGFSRHPLSSYATLALAVLAIQLASTHPSRVDKLSVKKVAFQYLGLVLPAFFYVNFLTLNHWTTHRAQVARQVTHELKAYPDLVDLKAVHVVSQSNQINQEVYFATLEGKQLRVLTKNSQLKLTFEAFTERDKESFTIKLL
jgi:hypothetical protein